MDQRKELNESELRRVVQSRSMPSPPLFLTERVMGRVRREQQAQFRRQVRHLFLLMGVAVALMLGVGGGMLIWLSNAAAEFSLVERCLLIFVLLGLFLSDLHRRLRRRLGIPE